jgi:8-oxo-dGTP diphosphatase
MLAIVRREIAVLLLANSNRARWSLPAALWGGREQPKAIASRLYRELAGTAPLWCEQVDARTDGAHPWEASISLVFAAAALPDSVVDDGATWHSVARLPARLASRQRSAVASAVTATRARLDREPIAFRLLPSTFTLTDAQRVYEALLGRRLHKASFRRTLLAARLVMSTDAWRSAGRGRPAQLFQYAPRTRRGVAASLRFEQSVS